MKDSEEVIAEKRRARQIKKEQAALKKQALGDQDDSINAVDGFNASFIKREFKDVATQTFHDDKHQTDVSAASSSSLPQCKQVNLSLLTYNVLAQSLVRRKLFPNSGEALKWKNRQKVLMGELQHYDCDVLCLQEMGHEMLEGCIGAFLQKSGYAYEFYAGRRKKHGLVIAYKKKRFTCITRKEVDYDSDAETDAEEPKSIPGTRNVGLVCVLQDLATNIKFVVATTHLFWHPKGTVERARQMEILLRTTMLTSAENCTSKNVIVAGDFNTEPMDPTYLSITQRPFVLNDVGRKILEESSVAFVAVDEEDVDDEADSIGSDPGQVSTCDASIWISRMNRLSNAAQFSSLYGRHYSSIAPGKSGINGEPTCTNFAHIYRGTLDYILVPQESSILCDKLLEVPDISTLKQSQPSEGEFPSDHFALGSFLRIIGQPD